jgi:hypothetical protein
MAVAGARFSGGEGIERALIKAFEQWTKEDIDDKFWKAQFIDRRWRYDGVTIRKNKDTVGPDPRDIYDLGLLYESTSYSYSSSSEAAEAQWNWGATNSSGDEYASYVHDGTKFMPGRPFTNDVSDVAFSFRRPIGRALLSRVQTALREL